MTSDEIGKGVVDHGPATFTDGYIQTHVDTGLAYAIRSMAFTDDGRLIFGDYAHGAVFAWDVKLPINKGKKICADEKLMQWPGTCAACVCLIVHFCLQIRLRSMARATFSSLPISYTSTSLAKWPLMVRQTLLFFFFFFFFLH